MKVLFGFAAKPACVLLTLWCAASAQLASAEELFLADQAVFPGRLWQTDGGREWMAHQRSGRPDPAYPNAVMKLGQVAVSSDRKVYYVSGLDGSLMHLLDGRNEIQAFEFPGQIRDVACTGEEHTVYFSVVPTPQSGEPLADGRIYRRDLWEGRPTEIAVIRQADVGGNWWGTFTIRDGVIYLATTEARSRLFQWTSGAPEPVFADNTLKITGLATTPSGEFLATTGERKVYRTTDFVNLDAAWQSARRVTDVALPQSPTSPRP